MRCPVCGAELVRPHQMPQDKSRREYHFACGSWTDRNKKFRQSWQCDQIAQGKPGRIT